MSIGDSEICGRFGVASDKPSNDSVVGVARNVGTGLQPLNGLRHPAQGQSCGWYLWAGESLSDDPDFFEPLHLYHLLERCPDIVPYLSLPAGWRVLLADGYEDAWFDADLLKV